MQRILVAVDNSEPSRRALQFLAKLRDAKLDMQIRLVHVQELAVIPTEYIPPQAMEAMLESRRKAHEEALGEARFHAERLGLTLDMVGARGDAAAEIVREAEAWKADQILMGTRGLGLVQSLVVGSVAQKVMHLTQIPVTLVK